MSEKDTAKQRLVDVTIEFICQGKKPSEITVADITERAEVGNGMVNYHFQSKDNLMREAVKKVTVCAKKSLSEKLKPYKDNSAPERLAIILKETMDFFADSPEICRIAILDNLENDNDKTNILGDVDVYIECMNEIYSNNSCRMSFGNYTISAFMDFIFLKAEVIKKETDFDFYDKQQRDLAIDNFINVLRNCSQI